MATTDKLLLQLRKKDTPFSVTRKTLKALSAALAVPETTVIHVAVARLAKEVLPAYEADQGPLKPEYFEWLKNAAQSQLPKGKLVSKKSLL